MNRRKNRRGYLLIAGGVTLIAAALCLTGYNFWEERQAAASVGAVWEQLMLEIPEKEDESFNPQTAEGVPEVPEYILNPEMEMPVCEIDGRYYIGVLEIPALGLKLPVLSEWNDPDMKLAPCRYSGSVYLDDMVIVAHNYDHHFGRLKTLSAGDTVSFTDMDGNRFSYRLVETEMLRPSQVEEMIDGDSWDLTLFTCTVDSQYRIAVRFEKENTV